ncbi:MAG: integrin [Kofleriaceae bacterium]
MLPVAALASCGDDVRIAPDVPDAPSGYAHRNFLKASNSHADIGFGGSVALSHDGSVAAIAAMHEDSIASGIDGDQSYWLADDSGAVYVFDRTATSWTQGAYIKAFESDPYDSFGMSLGLSSDGSVLVVGAPGDDSGRIDDEWDNSAAESGAAFVFERTSSGWTEQAVLKAPQPTAGVELGWNVAISGDGSTIAVASAISGNTGEVHLFTRSSDGWMFAATVRASNAERDDLFGWSVALSGDGSTLAVGAIGEKGGNSGINGDASDNSIPLAGAVYVFTRTDDAWSQTAYVKSLAPEQSELFGIRIALSSDGSVLAVAADGDSSGATGVNGDPRDTSAPVSGAAYVVRRTGSEWSHEAYIKASHPREFDLFGLGLALSPHGETLAVGAPGEAGFSGAVHVFERTADSWVPRAHVEGSPRYAAESFGDNLALSAKGETLLVGSPGESSSAVGVDNERSDGSAPDSGAVYVLQKSAP